MPALILQQEKLDKEQPDNIDALTTVDKYGTVIVHRTSYKPEFCNTAIAILSDPGNSIAHLGVALGYSRVTIKNWMKRYPDFREAIIQGLEIGKAQFLTKMNRAAWEPSKDVNNNLINILARNLYGIDADSGPAVIINNNGSDGNLAEGETSNLYAAALEAEDGNAQEFDEDEDIEVEVDKDE